MELCVLASGSAGNCIFVRHGNTCILVDAGLSGRETSRRLAQIGARPEEIQGICITHEHHDHVAGLNVLQTRYGTALYANRGTIEALQRDEHYSALKWNVFTTGAPFQIGALTIEPFSVSHDAFEPVGFVISVGDARIGIATDIGVGTHLVRERLRGCHALVIEANHDEQLLQKAQRPEYLKQRIRGRQGHLSNRHAGEMLAEILGPQLQQVFLAHISSDCNRPELAAQTVQATLAAHGLTTVRITPTYAETVSEIWRLSESMAATATAPIQAS